MRSSSRFGPCKIPDAGLYISVMVLYTIKMRLVRIARIAPGEPHMTREGWGGFLRGAP